MTTAGRVATYRRRGDSRASNTELFFDLVYVFAVTQLSHRLLERLDLAGVLQDALLLAMVWLVWMYTTWVTDWLDPNRVPTRVMLLLLMLASLVMSAGLPEAFDRRGLWFGGAWAVMSMGRVVYTVWALRDSPGLQRNFQRILCWSLVSSVLAVAGGLTHGHSRELLWLLVVLVDTGGATVGFFVPGLGRSTTTDWAIDGAHLAERCQAFILIALGESVVVIGTTLSGLHHVRLATWLSFVLTFAGAVAVWWVYFDRAAEAAARVTAESDDPGRLGRSAYHLIHPVMVAGIIVTAAADELVLSHPDDHSAAAAWLTVGGTALFLFGHALFIYTVWRVVSWPRVIATALLLVIGPFYAALPSAALGLLVLLIVSGVIVSDGVSTRRHSHFADAT